MSFLKVVWTFVARVAEEILTVLDEAVVSVNTSTWITLSLLFFILSFLGQLSVNLDHHSFLGSISAPPPVDDNVCLPTDIIIRGHVYGH